MPKFDLVRIIPTLKTLSNWIIIGIDFFQDIPIMVLDSSSTKTLGRCSLMTPKILPGSDTNLKFEEIFVYDFFIYIDHEWIYIQYIESCI